MSSEREEDNDSRLINVLSTPSELLKDNIGSVQESLSAISGSTMKENGLLPRAEGYQRLKLCKRGYREVMSAKVCGVSFEGCPIWSWSLRVSDWAKIFITGTDEARLRQCHVSTWSFLRGKFEVVGAREVPSLEGVDLWLLSGSLEFVTVSAAPHSTPKACWICLDGFDREMAPWRLGEGDNCRSSS